MTDGQVVQRARVIDNLLACVSRHIEDIRASGHPNAEAMAEDLWQQCYQPAWATHVISHYLRDHEAWETGDFGIRHKAATKAVANR